MDYSTLSDTEINAKLAEKMGYQPSTSTPGQWLVPISKNNNAIRAFSPCTSRDDLAVVVRHITNKGKSWDFVMALVDPSIESGADTLVVFVFTCSPRVSAECCLEVLEG